jgi:hypothetical protein
MPLVTFCEGKGTAPVSLVGKIPEAIVSILPSKGEKYGDRNDSNTGVRKDSNRRPKRKRREEIDEEDQGLFWEEKHEKTRKLLEKDSLWQSLRERLLEPTVPVVKTKAHNRKVTEGHPD